MSDAQDGVRAGEVRIVPLPAEDAGLRFIGRIRTPWRERGQCPKNSRAAKALGEAAIAAIEIAPAYREGLAGLAGFSHVWVLYWMDRAARDIIVQAPKHLKGTRGVFALRSPARPNPIAMAACELIAIEGGSLRVLGVDCLDGTPLIDIKPYFPSTDSLPDARVP